MFRRRRIPFSFFLVGLTARALALAGRQLFFFIALTASQASALALSVLPTPRTTHPQRLRMTSIALAICVGLLWYSGTIFLFLRTLGAPWALWLGLPSGLLLAVVVGRQIWRWHEATSWARVNSSLTIGHHRPLPYYINQPYGLPLSERLKHLAIQGATGSGKTTLLKNLIVSDLERGAGLCVIDPKDDLIDSILPHVPPGRERDVILMDPADIDRPLGFNPLSGVPPERRSLATGELVAILRRHFRQAWGPRLEHILTNTIMALLEVPGATLLDVTTLLLDADLRRAVIDRLTNPGVREFFAGEFNQFLHRRGDALEPILNKIGPWRSYPELRGIIGQRQSTFDIRQVMDRGQILLVRIPQGELGEDVSSLLGALIVAKLQLAAHSRVALPTNRRCPFFLYVDEFQNFATESFTRILSEARAFGLGLICANQYPEQLPQDLQLAVSHNVATHVTCTQQQGRYQLHIHHLSDPEDAEPILVRPLGPLSAGDIARAHLIRDLSRETYGRSTDDLVTHREPTQRTTSDSSRRDRPVPAGSRDVYEE